MVAAALVREQPIGLAEDLGRAVEVQRSNLVEEYKPNTASFHHRVVLAECRLGRKRGQYVMPDRLRTSYAQQK